MSDISAMAAKQTITALSNLIMDNEQGGINKVPRLLTMDDYPFWKPRFEIFIDGIDPRLYRAISFDYFVPKGEGNIEVPYDKMSEDQRKAHDAEKKAYSYLIQAIPNEIFHQFRRYRTSHSLWNALQKRNEGNAALKELKASQLRKEFDHFICYRDEKIPDLINRYNHLLSELDSLGVQVSERQQVETLSKALPKSWRPFIMILKSGEGFEGMDLNDFITKLKEYEQEEQNLDRLSSYVQNPSLYCSGSIPPSATSANAPLQTAFTSSVSGSSSSETPSGPPFSAPSSKKSETVLPALNTEHFKHGSTEEVKEHMGMLSALVSSYDDLLKGKIGNAFLTQEDYEQIDNDEMERQDILWSYANLVRRAKALVKRTGMQITANKDTKLGFDKSAVTCYNCGEKGHFARECEKPKNSGSKYPFRTPQKRTDTSSEGSSKAMAVVQKDEGIDWSVQFKDTDVHEVAETNLASVQDLNDESASETDESESSVSEEQSSMLANEQNVKSASVSAAEPTPVIVQPKSEDLKACMTGNPAESKVSNVSGLPCASCNDYVQNILSLKTQVNDLTSKLHENSIIKGREKTLKDKIESQNKQIRELEVALLNKQDAIVFYINEIDTLKRDLASSRVDYETLNQKLKSYSTSSYLFEHIIDRRPQGSDSEKDKKPYTQCPPPVLNQLVKSDVFSEADQLPPKVDESLCSTSKPVLKKKEVVGEPQKKEAKQDKLPEAGMRKLVGNSTGQGTLMKNVQAALRTIEKEGAKSPATRPYEEVEPRPKQRGLGIEPKSQIDKRVIINPAKQQSSRICYVCRRPGHLSYECDQQPQQSGNGRVDHLTENFQRNKTFTHHNQRSTPPVQLQRTVGQTSSKPISPDVSKKGTAPLDKVVNTSSVYHKASPHQVLKWANKPEPEKSNNSDTSTIRDSKGTGVWINMPIIGEDGKPKTIRAWVPNAN